MAIDRILKKTCCFNAVVNVVDISANRLTALKRTNIITELNTFIRLFNSFIHSIVQVCLIRVGAKSQQ